MFREPQLVARCFDPRNKRKKGGAASAAEESKEEPAVLSKGAREAAAETEKAQRTIQVTVMREHFFKAKPPSDGGQEEFEVMNKQLNKTGDVVDSMTTQLRHKELEVWREVPVRC